MLGVDPRPFTYRRLAAMAEARRLEEWDRTAEIVAKIHNKFNNQPKPPRTFHPYRQRPKRLPKLNAKQLAELMKG